jgi:hypothetical protein
MLRREQGYLCADNLADCAELGKVWFTDFYKPGVRRVYMLDSFDGGQAHELNMVFMKFSRLRKWRGDKRSNYPRKHK